MRRVCCLIVLHLISFSALASDKWIAVDSPNFRVITNGSDRQARDVAVGFEQLKAAVSKVLLNVKTESPQPIVILAVRDGSSLRKFGPSFVDTAGFFAKGTDKNYAVVRLEMRDRTIPYHGYMHYLLGLNFKRLPLWLGEGIAGFFSNSRIVDQRVLVGTPGPEIRKVRGGRLIELKELVSAEENSAIYQDEHRVETFYAQTWALTSYLLFADGMGRGQKFGAYLKALEEDDDPFGAFTSTFGNLQDIEKSYHQYLHLGAYSSFVVETRLDAKTFPTRQLSTAEADAELGGLRELVRTKKPYRGEAFW